MRPLTSRPALAAATAGLAAFAAACAAPDADAQDDAFDLTACAFDAVAVCLVATADDAGHAGDEACDGGPAPVSVTYLPLAMHSGLAEVVAADGTREIVSASRPDSDLFFDWAGGVHALEHVALEGDAPAAASLLERRPDGDRTLIDVRNGACAMVSVAGSEIEARFGVAP